MRWLYILKVTYPSLTYLKIRSNGDQEVGQSKLQNFSKNRVSEQLGRQFYKNHNNSTTTPNQVIPMAN
jgi:hypothetical protein